MRNYRIMPDAPFHNGEGKCNNPSCPNPRIYWTDKVLNAETGKKLPLNEPFTGLRPPQIHGCMREHPPSKYVNKTNDDFLKQISYSKELYAFLKRIHWTGGIKTL